MPTPFEDLYTAAKAIMQDVDDAIVPRTMLQAKTNYGDDFRIVAGTSVYQIQIAPLEDFPNSNFTRPRASCVVLIHHYTTNLTNEENFLHIDMSEVADRLLVKSVWRAEPGIYDLDRDVEPEISEGEREGNVITFEVTAVVLMDAV